MLTVLLPPSEGKTAPAVGAPVDLGALHFAELAARREQLLVRLERLCSGRPARALEALGLSASQAGELERNRGLREAPAAPASEVYSGVLFERLRLPELGLVPAGRRVVIASALWGLLDPADRIPAYRLSIGARLPRTPNLAAWWRPALRGVLPDEGLVVDLRSGAYAAAWQPRSASVVAVRAFAVAPDGSRRPVSHMAKRARGDVARVLLQAPVAPREPREVAALVSAAGMRAELQPAGARWTLDVLE